MDVLSWALGGEDDSKGIVCSLCVRVVVGQPVGAEHREKSFYGDWRGVCCAFYHMAWE
jgi:hypothetical protein